jgi:hypothetical protein
MSVALTRQELYDRVGHTKAYWAARKRGDVPHGDNKLPRLNIALLLIRHVELRHVADLKRRRTFPTTPTMVIVAARGPSPE